jgi:hypothetical protein
MALLTWRDTSTRELIKPRPWAFNPGLTAPEWRWFWDDGGSGWLFDQLPSMRDTGPQRRGLVGQSSAVPSAFESSRFGSAITIFDTGYWDTDNWWPSGTIDFTFVLVAMRRNF